MYALAINSDICSFLDIQYFIVFMITLDDCMSSILDTNNWKKDYASKDRKQDYLKLPSKFILIDSDASSCV